MIINFQIPTQLGLYSDTLILPDDVEFTEQDIELLKQERVDAWLNYMANPPIVIGPPPEEILQNEGFATSSGE
jgi:hypothetical protein